MSPLERALDELGHALGEFVLLLQREADALAQLQPDILASVVEEKARWADKANAAWHQLAAAARGASARGDALDQTLLADPGLAPRWREIKLMANKAERLNQGNNVLIESQLRRTRLALDVLQTASNRGGVYGADGQLVDPFRVSNSLDKA